MIILKTRKWGSSIGMVIPKKIAKELKIRENQDVIVDIKPKENPLKELFGSGKFSKPTEQILKEIRGKESKFI
ncbi:AbrB/MazE/SpoVT family DNA-binding domain-containing protein [Candidatus Woesearchaeota archaeon]|nr:AbrB/MazE/SpoVT family DNA-binding domain-containing protein [Candidatus Woesearchaeota archaeon]